MPITTDLSNSPYFDDFDENKDFHKILFQPGVPVQVREVNQLQTILQKQIERFGDNILKRGTIVDGCDIVLHESFPYVKLLDTTPDGTPVNIEQFIGYYVKNQANIAPLQAAVQTVVTGFESRNPDLNTLYVRYINSGFANVAGVETEQSSFSANQTLTVYNPADVVEKVNVFDNSSGFSNTDTIVFTSAIAIQNSSGGTSFSNNFFINDHINNGTANVQIHAIDTTSNTDVVILRIRPRSVDLKAGNASLWSLTVDDSVQSTNASPSDVANVVDVIGSGAAALMRVGSAGEINTITMTNKGSGYSTLPMVSISSTGATTSQITEANVQAQGFLTQVTVANSSVSPVGSGYAVSVGKGVVYQKGYFVRVNEHLTIVEKYNNAPDQKNVGFDTIEEIVTSSQDTSLLDNASGQPSETSPGANRLKLTPRLVTRSKAEAEANTDFLSIVEFSGGRPYKQTRQTVYNIIGNEMARRTYEESGNYVIDQFLLNTKAASNLSSEATSFKVVVDPGQAYVRGNRVETITNYDVNVDKGTDTFVANNVTVSLSYGDYIRVNEVGGVFDFDIGGVVSLRSAAKDYLSGGNGGTTPTSAGTEIGTARIRSFVHESGVPGTAGAVYRLYLFDIRLNAGRNFASVRSVFNDGTNKGVADVVLDNGRAELKDTNRSSLLMYGGRPAVKTGNNFSYIYRTINDTGAIKLAANGIITFAAPGNETFPYTSGSTLSTAQESDVVIVPLQNVDLAANITGTITVATNNTQVIGSGTTFINELVPGDYVRAVNSTANAIVGQVSSVVNNTLLTLTSNGSTAYSGSNAKIAFPAHVPISLDRSTRTANVNNTANTITINLGSAANVQANVAVAFNVRSSNSTPVVKTTTREQYVRIDCSNNAAGVNGPWCLGIPDVFRLRGVYLGSNNTFVEGDGIDITNDFYIDHNQNKDYYGVSYLYIDPSSSRTFQSSDRLLVKFDYFTDSGEGLKAPGSAGTYSIDDTVALANASSSVNTLEIPEVFTTDGTYYDLRDYFDFRPKSANTVAPNANSSLAPINPSEPSNGNRFTSVDKRFPAPDSTLSGALEYYQGRVDRVTIDENGSFTVIRGVPDSYQAPIQPENALSINTVIVPPYPSLPYALSPVVVELADTRIANERFTQQRLNRYRVLTPYDINNRRTQQPRGYKMTDIAQLERRIEDLEYYVSFTYAETQTQKRVIPSSSDTNINRFKFGFYVDTFNSYQYAAVDHPGFNAAVVDGRLIPSFEEINLPARAVVDGDNTTLPFIESTFISQLQATDGPVEPTPAPTPTPTPTPNTTVNTSIGTIVVTPTTNTTPNTEVVQKTTSITQAQRTLARSDSGSVWEDFFYTMSTEPGNAELYLNARDNNMACEIFQSSTQNGPWASIKTSATAQAITSSDVITKRLHLNEGRTIEHQGTLERKSYGPVGRFLEDQFKMLWSHDPTNGLYYRIRIYKGGNHGGQGRSGSFEYKLFYPIDAVVNNTQPVNGFANTVNYPISYFGMWSFGYYDFVRNIDTSFEIDTTHLASPSVAPTTREQTFEGTASGLRPNTVHTLTIEGEDYTARAKQDGKTLGSGLKSDENGQINFIFYYYSDIEPTSQVSTSANILDQEAGTKTLLIKSADGNSSATTLITVKPYLQQAINTSNTTPSAPPTSNTTNVSTEVEQAYKWIGGLSGFRVPI